MVVKYAAAKSPQEETEGVPENGAEWLILGDGDLWFAGSLGL